MVSEAKSDRSKDNVKIDGLIKQLHGEVPHIEEFIKKLSLRKDSDPYLSSTVKELQEAINLENVTKKLRKAKI